MEGYRVYDALVPSFLRLYLVIVLYTLYLADFGV